MSHSLNSLKGIIEGVLLGITIVVIKGDMGISQIGG